MKYQNTKNFNKNILTLIVLLTCAFMPVISMQFALKNDFFTQYFPQRFFISESIHNGNFPLWNPYINYGIPVYGDMNAGFWYPITWIMSMIGYSAYSFTCEIIFHILFAALGMYKLLEKYKVSTNYILLGALSYACSGFIIGHLQHFNWITAATWLPFCLLTLNNCFEKFSLQNSIKLSLSFSLFISSSHPGLIIGSFYFFLFIVVHHLYSKKINILQSAKLTSKLAFCIGISSFATLFGYLEIIPLFSRSEGFATDVLQKNALTPASLLSFIAPLTSTRLNAELSLQNCYIGLITFLFLIMTMFYYKKNKNNFILIIGLFFLILSAQNIFSIFFQEKLPFISNIRLTAENRLFALFAFIIYTYTNFDKVLIHSKRVLIGFSIAILTILIIYIFINYNAGISLLYKTMNVSSFTALKLYLDHLSFNDLSIIQFAAIIGLVFFLILKHFEVKHIITIGYLELIIFTLLQLPFTGVGTRPVNVIQQVIDQSPKGIPKPSMQAENQITSTYPQTELLIGDWSLYSKNIALNKYYPYPILLKNSATYFDTYENTRHLANDPFISPINKEAYLNLKDFTPNRITLNLKNYNNQSFYIKQNQYPGWAVYLNDSLIKPKTIYMAFPLIEVPKGNHEIVYRFEKPWIKFVFILQMLIVLIFFLINASNTFSRNRY